MNEPSGEGRAPAAAGGDGTLAAALPRVYRDPRHYDLLAQFTAPADGAFYRHLLERCGSPVLELGCGTGRVSLPLAQAGASVTGLDCSEPLLEHARLKAEVCGVEADFVLGDFRTFRLGRTFPLVICPYNAFNHLLDLESIRRCLASVAAHMDERSRFLVATFQPSPSFLGDRSRRERRIGAYVEPDGGRRVVMTERNDYDAARQINRIRWRYETEGQPEVPVDRLEMRIFFPQELDALLELSGFAIEEKWGSYERAPFTSTSSQQLVLCRRAG